MQPREPAAGTKDVFAMSRAVGLCFSGPAGPKRLRASGTAASAPGGIATLPPSQLTHLHAAQRGPPAAVLWLAACRAQPPRLDRLLLSWSRASAVHLWSHARSTGLLDSLGPRRDLL